MTELAKPVFITGIEDKLATIDVYGAEGGSGIQGLGSLNDFNPNSIKGMLGGNLGDPKSLIKSLTGGKLTLNPEALKKSLISAIPGAGAALGMIQSGMNVLSTAQGMVAQVQATVNGVTAMIKGADLSSITGVGKLIEGLTKAPFPISLKDNAGIAQVGSNLLKQCSALGLPGAYTQFATSLAKDGNLLTTITKNLLPAVVSHSNVAMLNEIVNGPLGKKLNSIMPGLVPAFSKAFKLPAGSTHSSIAATGKQVFNLYDRIQPTWNKTRPLSTRTPTPTSLGARKNSANVTLKASPDFKRMMAITASAKVTPVNIKPQVTDTGPSVLSASFGSTFPAGTSSVAAAQPDGSQITVYTWPDGTKVTRVVNATKTEASADYEYPSQSYPAAAAGQYDPFYMGESVPASPYQQTQLAPITDPQVLPLAGASPDRFGLSSFGADARNLTTYNQGGQRVYEVTMGNGERYFYSQDANGELVSNARAKQSFWDLNSATGAPQDPFVNMAGNTAKDPVTMAVAINSASEGPQPQMINGHWVTDRKELESLGFYGTIQSRSAGMITSMTPEQREKYYGAPASVNDSAARALTNQFPETYLEGVSDSQDW